MDYAQKAALIHPTSRYRYYLMVRSTIIIPELNAVTPTHSASLAKIMRQKQRICSYKNYYSLLFDLFGITQQDSISVAAITGLALGLNTQQDHWLFAEPMELKPDLAGVYGFGNTHLQLTESENQQFAKEINELLTIQNIKLHAMNGTNWFLQCADVPEIQTVPSKTIMGKEISPYLPVGPQQKQWRKLLTELQMLLHFSPTNKTRVEQGLPPVNGIWFWGEGSLPKITAKPFSTIFTDDLFTQGLAKLSNTNCLPLSAIETEITENEPSLIVVTDLSANTNQFDLEKNCFLPLMQALKNNRLTEFVLYPNLQNYYVYHKAFWRRWYNKFVGLRD